MGNVKSLMTSKQDGWHCGGNWCEVVFFCIDDFVSFLCFHLFTFFLDCVSLLSIMVLVFFQLTIYLHSVSHVFSDMYSSTGICFYNALHFVGHLSHFLQVDLNDKYAQSSQHLWKYCIVGVLMMLHESKLSSWGVVLQVASYLFHNVVHVLPCSGCVALLWYVQLGVCIALLCMCWGSFLKWLEHGPITPAPVFVFGMEWKGKSVSGEFWAFLTHYLIQWEEDVRICLFCLLVFLCSFKRNLGLCEEQQCSTLWKSRSWWSAAAPDLLQLLT